jgi:hypothetical protein
MPHVFSLAKSNSSTVRNRKETASAATDIPEIEGTEDNVPQKTVTEILWKIDWVFQDIHKTLSDNCISENRTIRESLDRFFNDTWKLGPTRHLFEGSGISGVDDLQVRLVTASKEDLLVNINVPIREALNGHAIIEYPVFHIQKSNVS